MYPKRKRKSLLLSVAFLIVVWKLRPIIFISHPVGGGRTSTPLVQGGEDEDQTARERRDYIRGEEEVRLQRHKVCVLRGRMRIKCLSVSWPLSVCPPTKWQLLIKSHFLNTMSLTNVTLLGQCHSLSHAFGHTMSLIRSLLKVRCGLSKTTLWWSKIIRL